MMDFSLCKASSLEAYFDFELWPLGAPGLKYGSFVRVQTAVEKTALEKTALVEITLCSPVTLLFLLWFMMDFSLCKASSLEAYFGFESWPLGAPGPKYGSFV